jgi:ABC-type lipoprotein release transport system permease subunit
VLIVKLAWRSLWRNRRRTLITLSSIGLGLALTIWTETMVEGSHNTMISKATRLMAGHVTVEKRGYNESPGTDLFVPSVSKIVEAGRGLRGLERAKVMILAQAVASSGNGSSAISLIGLEPEAEADESPLVKGLVKGRFIQSGDARGVFIGEKLAERLQLDVGKKMVVTTTDSHGELASDLLRVVGIFRTGSVEMDTYLVQVPLGAARRALNMGADQATQVGFLLTSAEYQEEAIERLRARLGSTELAVLPWEKVMPELASWVALFGALSRGMVYLMLVLVGFNILNTILMSVIERDREFATLLSLGTPPGLVRLQVLFETVFLGVFGSAFGLVLGGRLALWGSRHGVDLSAFLRGGLAIGGFPFDMMVYNHITVPLLLRLVVIVFVGTVIIGLYPTYKSTRVKVADSLRAR